MAELQNLKVELKILDLDSFKELVEALGDWAVETASKDIKSKAEEALLNAAVRIADEQAS